MKAKTVAFIVLAGVLLYFPLFLKLDALPFRIWDEARPAVQAYEMAQSGNFLVTTFEGRPDLWYTKPPLQVWLQVACIHVFGYGELAIRLPSALAALATCVLLMFFLHRITRSWWFGFMAALVLVTTEGYVNMHGSRSGDVDALLAFLLTLCACSVYLYTEDERKPQYLYVFFVGLAAAVLAKGIAGLFLLPAFAVFALWRKQVRPLLGNRHFYAALGIFVLVIGSFYGLREWAGPGYLKAVWQNELLGRYGQTLEGHNNGFFFYVDRLVTHNAILWVCLLGVGTLAGLFGRNSQLKRLTQYVWLLMLQYLLLISLSETKPYWYDIPLYPFWAIVVAIPIYMVYTILPTLGKSQNYFVVNVVPYVFVLLVFIGPYRAAVLRSANTHEPHNWDEPFYALPNYLRLVYEGKKPSLAGWSIAYEEYYTGHLLPYRYLLAERGQQVPVILPDKIQPGQQIISNREAVNRYIDSLYTYTVVDTFESVKWYRVGPLKVEHAHN